MPYKLYSRTYNRYYQDKVEKVLTDVDHQGTFYFSRTYEDAPNPVLRLADLGTVGLPLSSREAAAVIERCTQAPFGKGERTVVDKDVRDTWELDGKQVAFDNPAWTQFIAQAVQDVCRSLGVNFEASKPRCELHKLLVYETGSHFLPHVDTEKHPSMFASLIVVLPTLFAGGDAHLSHGSQSTVLNSSRASLAHTTVLAWYTDIMHEIKPIERGYRLALSYNLIHTTTSIRPSLSANTAALDQLRGILASWAQPKQGPDKIVYLLDHTYSKANFSASALKGSDAHVIAMLDEVAKTLGFHLALGHLVLTVRSSEYDYDRDADIENIVDLEGSSLHSKSLSFDYEVETIPAEFVEELCEQAADEEDHESYTGNVRHDESCP
ncbi:hypothetical protein EXIGLDRAFT_614267 [Exidia glandulosa HHB12029]|uniref:Uncharacterized protein n=1 Tax=Exidia glandulosa HHB12029 TaxID=1314781 RepID=A0A165HV79_EXIGL|nr:hypothetical protein EXIGLDRAFT_614267 [Exidia glandulosa HHB12029]